MVIGYTCGVYDIFHEGHVELLKNAKSMCDKLIVGLTTDEQVSYKGKYPIMSYNQRKIVLESNKYVDLVIPQHNHDKVDAWLKLKFDILFVGDDWYNSEQWNNYEKRLKEFGVKVVYFPYTRGISTTLLKRHIVHPNNVFFIFNSTILCDIKDIIKLNYDDFLNYLNKWNFSDDIIRIFHYLKCNNLHFTIVHQLNDEDEEHIKIECLFNKIGILSDQLYYDSNGEYIKEISKLNKTSPEFIVLFGEQFSNNKIICYEKIINSLLKWEDFIDGLYNTKNY